MSAPARQRFVGCGIFRRELELIRAQRGLDLDLELLGPALHVDPPKLERALLSQLERHRDGPCVFFGGACHPRVDQHLAAHGARRPRGLNCLEMLLGADRYQAELERGAYFLLEAWAHTWRDALDQAFGKRPGLIRDVFQGAHTCVLAVRTPCSGDFTALAEAAAAEVGLPLEWATVDLTQLEEVVLAALAGAARTATDPRSRRE